MFEADRILEAVRRLDDGEKRPTARRLELECGIAEEDWRPLFGTWDRVMVAAGRRKAPIVRRLESASGQHLIDSRGLHELDARTKELTGLYAKPADLTKPHWILVVSDVHDVRVDPFWLHVFLETVRLTAKSVGTIVLNGDIWDGFEFSRHTRDFRQWQLGRRVRFVHNFLAAIRERNPDAQIVFVEGNHEHWILRYFNERAPELMALFSDLHGFDDVASLLGIHRFGIHYCSQARLSLPTLGKVRREINENNFWMFGDAVKFIHYRPRDRDVTVPGVNGHHHSFELRGPFHRPDLGPFHWMQIGCGCRALEGWAAGDKWERGFGFVQWDPTDLERKVKMHTIIVSDSAQVFSAGFRRDPARDLKLYGELGGFTERELSACYSPATWA